MNKKGQALIEFILIMPIILMLLLAVFDWARIINAKIDLENNLDNYVEYHENNNNIDIKNETTDKYVKYTATDNIEIYSPVLTVILGNNYLIKIDRYVYEK